MRTATTTSTSRRQLLLNFLFLEARAESPYRDCGPLPNAEGSSLSCAASTGVAAEERGVFCGSASSKDLTPPPPILTLKTL
jgi:hypothetical protein